MASCWHDLASGQPWGSPSAAGTAGAPSPCYARMLKPAHRPGSARTLRLTHAAVQEVGRQSETAAALLGWIRAVEAVAAAASSVRSQQAERDACAQASADQEAALAAARPVLDGLLAELHALQVRAHTRWLARSCEPAKPTTRRGALLDAGQPCLVSRRSRRELCLWCPGSGAGRRGAHCRPAGHPG